MPTIIVDGREIEAAADDNLLEVLLSNDINIPYFCWHPAMGSVGACRQCAVIGYAGPDDERGRIVMSCMTAVTDGARFSVAAENAENFRDSVIENLMLNHPHDCPVCEEGGECHLQDMTVMVGHRDRHYSGLKTTFRNQYLGPLIGHEMNRCITCYRCVRYYQDYAGGEDLAAFGSRDRVFFGRAEPGVLENEFAGNLVEVCPTGVFTDKTLSKHYTRKWDLQSSPTICQACSLGCNTYTSERYGELRRIHNRYHHEVNGYFLCDRGRFGAQHVNAESRIPRAGIRNADGLYDAVAIDTALAGVRAMVAGSTVGIGSPRASLESNEALRALTGAENFANGMTQTEREMHQVILDVLRSNLNTPSVMETESFDAVIVIGEDVTNHAPRLALSLRQAVRNKGRSEADQTGIAQWHDAAVRELTQHDLSPFMVLTPMPDRMDDVATDIYRLPPNDIVRTIERIIDAMDSDTASREKEIADQLLTASRPLVVSGTSLGSVNILKVSANLASALATRNPGTGIFLCASEANSIGGALIDNNNDVEALLNRKPETVIVLENDVLTRFDPNLLIEVKNLVVLDCLDNATASAADIVLPAAAFSEQEGSFVNNEGRLQRSHAVYPCKGDVAPAYHLLTLIAGEDRTAKQMQQIVARSHAELEQIDACAPDENFRVEGCKVARMTHRASGRTAMLADVSVHEPRQPVDAESALAFTMEGNQSLAPASLRAYTWSPGWNSNQSIHKFQSEIGGADKSGDPGVRIFTDGGALQNFNLESEAPRNLIGQAHIFGSDGVSNQAEELATLIPAMYARMNRATAQSLGVGDRDGIACNNHEMTVIIDEGVAENCVIFPALPGTSDLFTATLSELEKVDGHVAPADPIRPSIITTDRNA
jgi:NADH-quinone oxidoreductase subunit G